MITATATNSPKPMSTSGCETRRIRCRTDDTPSFRRDMLGHLPDVVLAMSLGNGSSRTPKC
jgi:hypothetical protein